MEELNRNEEERRSIRHKKRRNSQIGAYLLLTVLILILAGGAAGIGILVKNNLKENEIQEEELEEHLDQVVGEEEEIEIIPPEPAVPEMTPEEKLDEIIMAAIGEMPLEDKVAGLFLVTPEELTGVGRVTAAGETTQKALNEYPVGGLIYFKQNMTEKEKFSEMIQGTVAFSKYPLFLAVDEEGGQVSRLAEAGFMEGVESAQDVGATNDPVNAYDAGLKIAEGMNAYGLNLNLAPVTDISNVENSAMKTRSYGSDAAVVGSMAASMVKAMQENGISACLKHFPGIGSTTQDTHSGMATTERTAEEFRNSEFAAFRTGMEAGAEFVMVGHISAPALTGDKTPCSLSKAVVTDILRKELDYDGVIISDALSMTSITEYYTSEQAAVLALKAGCDMVLMPENFEEAYRGVLDAVENGTISEERIDDSLKRIYRIKYADRLETE